MKKAILFFILVWPLTVFADVGPPLTEVFFTKSTDRGITWVDSFIRVGGELVIDSRVPIVATSYSDLYIAWASSFVYATNNIIYVGYSHDGGNSWFPEFLMYGIRVDDTIYCAKRNPTLAKSQNKIFCVWQDERNDSGDIYFAKSYDGYIWTHPNIKVNDSTQGIQINPSIASSNNNLYVAWEDDRNGSWDIYFAKSTDAGSTWTAPNIKVNPSMTGEQKEPYIIAENDSLLFIVWRNIVSDTERIYFSRSTNGGEDWESLMKLNNIEIGERKNPSIDIRDSIIVVAWQDTLGGESHIYFTKSEDMGESWADSNIRIDDGTSGDKIRPSIGIDDSNYIYAVWEDYRTDSSTIYFARSIDGGLTWTTPNIQIGDGHLFEIYMPQGDKDDGFPSLKIYGNNIYVAWQLHGETPMPSGVKEVLSFGKWYLECSPNPASDYIIISYGVPKYQKVELSIHDVSGRKIDKILSGTRDRGFHTINWERNYKKIKSGVYFLKLQADGISFTEKIILM